MAKSTRTTKVMPKGYTYPVGKPAAARHGESKDKVAPPCADHGSAVDGSVPRSKLFPAG